MPVLWVLAGGVPRVETQRMNLWGLRRRAKEEAIAQSLEREQVPVCPLERDTVDMTEVDTVYRPCTNCLQVSPLPSS